MLSQLFFRRAAFCFSIGAALVIPGQLLAQQFHPEASTNSSRVRQAHLPTNNRIQQPTAAQPSIQNTAQPLADPPSQPLESPELQPLDILSVPLATDRDAPANVNQVAQPVVNVSQFEFEQSQGVQNYCSYSICNSPSQPQVAAGRCQPCTIAIDCADNCGRAQTWADLHPYQFQPLAQGEYLGPIRLPSTLDYRIRIGDQLRFIFIDSPSRSIDSYRLMVGDELQIESTTDSAIRRGDLVTGRGLIIQPDGKVTVSLVGQIHAAGLTIPQLRHNLEIAYQEYIREPSIDVTPIKTNSLKTSILNSVDARQGAGGQNYIDLVHPDGTIRLPKIGAVCVQGMTVDEIKREVNLRYRQIVAGLEIEPIINSEAPHFVFVTGEVGSPGRYQLLGPTSVTQALALAGGTKVGGNLREIVIFRRAEDWRLLATRIDLRGAHLGKVPTPADEIWLRDSDLIIVPQTPIKLFNNFVKQVFTDGVYGVVPFGGYSISQFRGNGFSN